MGGSMGRHLDWVHPTVGIHPAKWNCLCTRKFSIKSASSHPAHLRVTHAMDGIIMIVSLQVGEYNEKVFENPSLLFHTNISIIRGLQSRYCIANIPGALWSEYDPDYQRRYSFAISNVFTYTTLDPDNNASSDSNADLVTNKYKPPTNTSPSCLA
jgi:hypothetical protein